MSFHRPLATGASLSVQSAIAGSGSAAFDPLLSYPAAGDGGPGSSVACADLLERFGEVSDGRADQGRAHPVAVVLALCAAAVVAGMRSFTAIAGWVGDVPAELLGELYGRCGRPGGRPSKATIWRVVTGANAAVVDAVIGAWLAEQLTGPAQTTAPTETGETGTGETGTGEDAATGPELIAIAVDGKTVRGASDAQGNQVHLLAAMTHDQGLVVGQVEVGAKTNEIPMFAPLLEGVQRAGVDLAGVVVTADALHTQRAHAHYLHERGTGFVLTVKDNQPRLSNALNALPWTDIPIGHQSTDRGHGRITRRTVQLAPAPPELPFPHIHQVWLVERYVTDLAGNPLSAVAALGVTSISTQPGTPELLATLVRNHWRIESLHWLRDTVYREDDSTAHTRSGPQVMAALRNLAIGALRLAGRTDITEATRWAGRFMHRPFKILKMAL